MTAPYPGAALPVMHEHRKRLWVVDDNNVVVNMIADGVLENNFLVNFHLQFGKINIRALKGIMHLLRDAEEIGRTLYYPSTGPVPRLFIRSVSVESSSATSSP